MVNIKPLNGLDFKVCFWRVLTNVYNWKLTLTLLEGLNGREQYIPVVVVN